MGEEVQDQDLEVLTEHAELLAIQVDKADDAGRHAGKRRHHPHRAHRHGHLADTTFSESLTCSVTRIVQR